MLIREGVMITKEVMMDYEGVMMECRGFRQPFCAALGVRVTCHAVG